MSSFSKFISELVASATVWSAVKVWVACGAASGAFVSAVDKAGDIMQEPTPKYKNKTIEKPMRGVYHTTRVAAHAGLGAFVGGAVALTAPVSIPAYVYWRNDLDQKQSES